MLSIYISYAYNKSIKNTYNILHNFFTNHTLINMLHIFIHLDKKYEMEVENVVKRKANHVRPGMNAAKAQGQGAGYNEELSNEPLTEEQRQHNKKRKKNQ